ncbi:MAG: 50S ribosomal protein L25/general stress protein Ctc [Actinomycetota bacterium]|nr:50S ribosomal protein L25/general stress protein Ctc [Actinomycetota bacterium]MDQ2958534.1 50S ribosomal protein L25/general stress protein Ctc [Actinomycetota bacterium]
MSEVRLAADVRTDFGKGGARRTRRAGKIPAVIYGHGAEPKHVSLPAREFSHAIKRGGVNVLLTLSLDGEDQLTIPKAIQRHPIRGEYEHVDLLAVRLGEKVTVDVRLVLIGEIAPGGLLAQEHTNVTLEAEATHLPTEIEISIEGLQAGTTITAGDLELPDGSTLVTDAETLLIAVGAAPTAEEMEAEVAEASEELGIIRDKPAGDIDEAATQE